MNTAKEPASAMKANKTSEIEDVTLMLRLASGDSSALDKLYRKHHSRVAAFIQSNFELSDLGLEVDDIVQDVFKRVQEKAAQYRPTGKVLSWILKVAKNLTFDILRQHYSKRNRETSYAIERPPQGGEAVSAEAEALGEGAASGFSLPLGEGDVPDFVIIRRLDGGDIWVWQGSFPERRVKWGRPDKMRKWLQGFGRDDLIKDMFRALGLVHEDSEKK